MEPAEIIESEVYLNTCRWKIRVERISRTFGTIEYFVLTGPMRNRSGNTTIEDFADRMVSRIVPPKQRLTITELDA